jgi:hypothetical protein
MGIHWQRSTTIVVGVIFALIVLVVVVAPWLLGSTQSVHGG